MTTARENLEAIDRAFEAELTGTVPQGDDAIAEIALRLPA